MKSFKILFKLLVIAIVFIVGFGVYWTLTEYKPDKVIVISEIMSENRLNKIKTDEPISFISWNIGYCGLDKDMDFFYDGGEKVNTSKEQTLINLNVIREYLLKHDTLDFMLIQEVDLRSSRTYKINELDSFTNALPHEGYFAVNYNSDYVPVPSDSPMGKVVSGLTTFSNKFPVSSLRYAYPDGYAWPKSLFTPKRCFLVNRHSVENNKELLIINTHNTAYDDGELREKEMKMLKEFITKEYNKGNYIIVGGDWNQNPPGYKPDRRCLNNEHFKPVQIFDTFMPNDWQWVYDDTYPTNRYLNEKLSASTLKTLLDFYLVSPNIKVLDVNTVNLNFRNSDHNPVFASFKLES